MDNNNKKKFGFVRTSYDPLNKELIYSKNAEDYIHIIFMEERNLYFRTGKTRFFQKKIPAPYNQHEFTEFYRKKPPRITNNKDRAIDSLDQVFFVNE
jgi:hypothetical protein